MLKNTRLKAKHDYNIYLLGKGNLSFMQRPYTILLIAAGIWGAIESIRSFSDGYKGSATLQIIAYLAFIIGICGVIVSVIDIIKSVKEHIAAVNYNLIEDYPNYSDINIKAPEGFFKKEIQLIKYDSSTVKIDGMIPDSKIRNIIESKSINLLLRNENIEIIAQNDKDRRKAKQKFISAHFDKLQKMLLAKIHSLKPQQGFYNDKKLCLARDIEVSADGKSASVYFCKGCYYDAFLTNIGYNFILEDTRNGDDILLRDNIYEDGLSPIIMSGSKQVIGSLDESIMAQEIGVSTLCITKDKYMFLLIQNALAESSQGYIVPAGSGSADWSDFKWKSDFRKNIEYAMQRELYEECGLKKVCRSIKNIGKTKITGYFRWMEKSGSPEFTGITKINYNYHEIIPCTNEVQRQARSIIKVKDRNDLEEFRKEIYRYGTQQAEATRKSPYGKAISLPLIMCIENLIDAVDSPENGDKMAKFIFD